MTTRTLDRHTQAVHAAEVAALAMTFQYGLSRLLASAVERATRVEGDQLAPHPRSGEHTSR